MNVIPLCQTAPTRSCSSSSGCGSSGNAILVATVAGGSCPPDVPEPFVPHPASSSSTNFTPLDYAHQRAALAAAEQAVPAQEVPIGCVLVANDAVIATAHNRTVAARDATRHAEMIAIDELLLGERKTRVAWEDVTVYVTCEPCVMCASALQQLGVRRIVFGCANDRFGGCGSVLSVCEADGGCLADEGMALLKSFYARENVRAPEEKKRKR